MDFRIASKNDIHCIIDLAQYSIRNISSAHYSQEQIEAWSNRINRPKRIQEAIANQHFILAVNEEKLLGFASLLDGTYIDFLFVHPNYARTGIASEMYARLKKKANTLRQENMYTLSSVTAKPFFESKGFKTVEKLQQNIGNCTLVNYRMEIRLTSTKQAL